MNFDLENVKPFLMRLTSVVEGFSASQVSALTDDIAKLPVDTTLERTYAVRFQGKPVSLRVEAFMDDVNAPDLYFFGSQPLIKRLEIELKKFSEALGL